MKPAKKKGKVGDPTRQEYDSFAQAFDYFNKELFGAELPPALITYQRKARVYGYYSPKRFAHRAGKQEVLVDELAMNPANFKERSDAEILSTLVHEQTHHWQEYFGNPGRTTYHNREWSDKMISIGLMPTDTGLPGGKKTGQKMSHYIIKDGPFDRACQRLLQTGFRLQWQSRETDKPAGGGKRGPGGDPSKIKYTCPSCGLNLWGKSGAPAACGLCGVAMHAADGQQADCPAISGKGTITAAAWRSITKKWFADLAKRYHPDKTQDDGKAMSIINDANERLKALLENA
jgi:predicted SprT family Zn-dependent metalloprotease